MHDLSNKITWKKKKMYLIYKIYSLSWNVLSVRCFSMECLIFKMSFYETRLWGRFAAISFFNCEHFLFVYIVIQKKVRGFSKFTENRVFIGRKFLKFRSSINLPWAHTTFGPDWYGRFDVYWIPFYL